MTQDRTAWLQEEVADAVGASVQEELQASGYRALHHLSCRVSDGRVVLCGTVPSYYLKQVAQCVVSRRFGEQWAVENRVEVVRVNNAD
jgi:hypothetical protein